nr:DDE-type integrase/transposase/recombinase [Halomonas lutea]
MDISEVRTGESKAYLFVSVDRTSKFVHTQLYRQMTKQIAADFLEDTLQALPYHVHTVQTGNGVQFAKKAGTEAYKPHTFDVACYRHGIEHRLMKPFPPRTNEQVERMNRTIKDATTRAFHYTSLSQLQSHLNNYL